METVGTTGGVVVVVVGGMVVVVVVVVGGTVVVVVVVGGTVVVVVVGGTVVEVVVGGTVEVVVVGGTVVVVVVVDGPGPLVGVGVVVVVVVDGPGPLVGVGVVVVVVVVGGSVVVVVDGPGPLVGVGSVVVVLADVSTTTVSIATDVPGVNPADGPGRPVTGSIGPCETPGQQKKLAANPARLFMKRAGAALRSTRVGGPAVFAGNGPSAMVSVMSFSVPSPVATMSGESAMVTGRIGTSTRPSVPLPSHDPGESSTHISTVSGISNSMKNLTLALPFVVVLPATVSFDTVYRAASVVVVTAFTPSPPVFGSIAPNVAESVT
jgi:hypothetical protein